MYERYTRGSNPWEWASDIVDKLESIDDHLKKTENFLATKKKRKVNFFAKLFKHKKKNAKYKVGVYAPYRGSTGIVGFIEWSTHMEAYKKYVMLHGNESAEEIAKQGGFSIMFLNSLCPAWGLHVVKVK